MKLKRILKKIPFLKFVFIKVQFFIRKKTKPRESVFGFHFSGNGAMRNGSFEVAETKIIDSLLNHYETFIDIGANIGYYCCFALNKNIHTLAFEPLKSNLFFLFNNISANNFKNIEVFPIALGNSIGLIDLFGENTGASIIEGWANSKKFNRRLIPINTVNNIIGNRFENKNVLILVDIEGAEKFMLEEAQVLLDQNPKPTWIIEINIDEHQPKGIKINPYLMEIFTVFFKRNYTAIAINEHFSNVTKEDIIKIVNSGHNHLNTHNFIFVDETKEDMIQATLKTI